MSNSLSKMLSPRAARYLNKTSAEARRHSVALAIAAPLAAAAIEEAFRSFFSPSVCQMRGKDEPRCGSDVFLCGFNRDQLSSGCVCLGEDEDEEVCGRCEDCSVKLSGDDKGNDKCQDCLEQGCQQD